VRLLQEFAKGLVEEDDEGFTVRLDVRAAKAVYRDGMLELRLPKPLSVPATGAISGVSAPRRP
jgi:HSP20 family molecular chaperone IbpA